MVDIICNIENLDELKDIELEGMIHKEIESIVFRDDKGRKKRYKVKGLINQFTSYMTKMYPDTDWDWESIHVAILIGEEIKE